MKLTKIVFFITLMATGVASVYGMNIGPLTQEMSVMSLSRDFSEAYVLSFLRASNDYEQDILEESQENGLELLQMINCCFLHKAISQNYSSLLKFLIRKNINLAPENGQKILEQWMGELPKYTINSEEENDQKRFIDFLIKKGMDLNGIDKVYLNKVLNKAVLSGHSTVVEVLIENGAEVNDVLLVIAPSLYDSNNMNVSRIGKALLDTGANKLVDQVNITSERIIKENSDKGNTNLPKSRISGNPDDNNSILPEPHADGKNLNNDNNSLLKPNIGGNPDNNNPADSKFELVKAHKGFAFVGAVIGVGFVVWGCKKLYAKYHADKNKEEDESEQAEPVAD